MINIKPPQKLEYYNNYIHIFLAGTIDMGHSINWQKDMENCYCNNEKIIFYNPRRDNWDSSWQQSIQNDVFKEQVEWELKGLEMADYIIMNLLPDSQSPISMLELGLYAWTDKMIVCCPESFWRKGNIDIVCNWYNIKLVNQYNHLFNFIDNQIIGKND